MKFKYVAISILIQVAMTQINQVQSQKVTIVKKIMINKVMTINQILTTHKIVIKVIVRKVINKMLQHKITTILM